MTQRIINFTGMDGSGKSTALSKIAAILRNRGFTVREVSSRYFDPAVYDFIALFEQESRLENLLERFIHTLDLHVVIEEMKRMDLADIDFIMFDRHFLDKRVFFELRTGREWPEFFERLVVREYYPETHLYFKVEPKLAAWRLSRQRVSLDWKEQPELLERAPGVFEKYLARDSAARVDIDAGVSENLVLNQVMTALIGSKFD